MNDVAAADPHAVVLELYRLLSHSADSIIDRAAISALLLPDARVRCVMANDAGVEDVGNWTVPEYLDLLAAALERQRAAGMETERSELRHHMHTCGNIAQVFSTFEARMSAGGDVLRGRGVYAVQLVRVGGAWRIAGLASHTERARDPIPDGYLPERGVGSAGVSQRPGQTAA